MKSVKTRAELGKALACGENIGFVPTMGALHAGHMALVERAKKDGGMVVVSIFVNPTQFNDPDDLKRYPRTPEHDLELLEKAGVDVVFLPSEEEIYPSPANEKFDFGELDKVMEGASRPGHFNGVAQVVSRLFDLVQPARAYFGEKDFQQILIIREMVRQLNMPVKIVTVPIVREKDGLAMSSRNALLTPAEREAAPLIYKALQHPEKTVEMINANPLLKVIYFEKHGDRGYVAVQVGKVRLIDNMEYGH